MISFKSTPTWSSVKTLFKTWLKPEVPARTSTITQPMDSALYQKILQDNWDGNVPRNISSNPRDCPSGCLSRHLAACTWAPIKQGSSGAACSVDFLLQKRMSAMVKWKLPTQQRREIPATYAQHFMYLTSITNLELPERRTERKPNQSFGTGPWGFRLRWEMMVFRVCIVLFF